MFRTASKTARIRPCSASSRRCFSQRAHFHSQGSSSGRRAAASTAVVAATAVWFLTKSQTIYNDAPKSVDALPKKADSGDSSVTLVDDGSLNTKVWGSNK